MNTLAEEPVLVIEAKDALYRVAHEALNNIIKHARASYVEINRVPDGNTVVLTIHDDGVGFDPEESHPGHWGVQSMRERIERAGGVLTIESLPDSGTTVRAVLPTTPA